MGDPNERPVSKYFAKHFDVEEAFLYPVQCGKCKCWFAVDERNGDRRRVGYEIVFKEPRNWTFVDKMCVFPEEYHDAGDGADIPVDDFIDILMS